jgi:FAD/FMN-containing dehydrogenase
MTLTAPTAPNFAGEVVNPGSADYDAEGAYLNFVGDEGQERIRASFGEDAYRRLSGLKARLDPDNRFALNHNIEPAADS